MPTTYVYMPIQCQSYYAHHVIYKKSCQSILNFLSGMIVFLLYVSKRPYLCDILVTSHTNYVRMTKSQKILYLSKSSTSSQNAVRLQSKLTMMSMMSTSMSWYLHILLVKLTRFECSDWPKIIKMDARMPAKSKQLIIYLKEMIYKKSRDWNKFDRTIQGAL
jgi:hypothetical protein